jgi:hypothetical protein
MVLEVSVKYLGSPRDCVCELCGDGIKKGDRCAVFNDYASGSVSDHVAHRECRKYAEKHITARFKTFNAYSEAFKKYVMKEGDLYPYGHCPPAIHRWVIERTREMEEIEYRRKVFLPMSEDEIRSFLTLLEEHQGNLLPAVQHSGQKLSGILWQMECDKTFRQAADEIMTRYRQSGPTIF